ncbi:hypothetical protein BDV26DRAFT_298343 [Aspergillus bertholletiae]|uniref:aldehyde dehydrogenase (NAD(+)) n=1 Tax=Aspergillus bertholletiae TaxID=1226010 RepID=A0A5N7ARH5_9EURO|nr:hypothetical protein BDV26DRAFT_298343 [Aspergillus bertholletiae]
MSFTGSTGSGSQFSCPGNDAAIVCADVDVKAAATRVATLAFINSGQVAYIAIKKVYMHETIYDQFLHKTTAITKDFKMGSGEDRRHLPRAGAEHRPV